MPSVPIALDIVIIVVCIVFALLCMTFLRKRALRENLTWKLGAALILLTYMMASVGFGTWYHILFQIEPRNFFISTGIGEADSWKAILDHRENTERGQLAQEVIVATMAELRDENQRANLHSFATGLPEDVAEVYARCICLSVVGPPDTPDEQQIAAEIRAGILSEKEARELFDSWSEVAKERPGIVSPLPGWNSLQRLPSSHIVELQDRLAGRSRDLKKAELVQEERRASVKDSELIAQFLQLGLNIQLRDNERVDLRSAADAISRELIREETLEKLGKMDIRRYVFLSYFSLVTITTVGYGEIVPNSLCARLSVMVEVLVGIGILVFLVNLFLKSTPWASGKPRK